MYISKIDVSRAVCMHSCHRCGVYVRTILYGSVLGINTLIIFSPRWPHIVMDTPNHLGNNNIMGHCLLTYSSYMRYKSYIGLALQRVTD